MSSCLVTTSDASKLPPGAQVEVILKSWVVPPPIRPEVCVGSYTMNFLYELLVWGFICQSILDRFCFFVF